MIRATLCGAIEAFMAADHVRIDDLLRRAEAGSIDDATYATFRGALLRHIAMEEKVLLPAARTERGGVPLPVDEILHADHGAIAKMLVRSPTPALLDGLRRLLAKHNSLEEGPDGLYAACDALMSAQTHALVERMRMQPEVPLAKYYDGPSHERR